MSELLVSWDFDGGIKCQDTGMTRISRSFNGCKILMPAVVAKASRAAIRATPAAHVKSPCLHREMFHGVRAYTGILHPMESSKDRIMESIPGWTSDDGHLCSMNCSSDLKSPDERSGRIQGARPAA
jgi:hypothetical protein